MKPTLPVYHIEILNFDVDKHRFSSLPLCRVHYDNTKDCSNCQEEDFNLEQAYELGPGPSQEWMTDYQQWNHFREGHPNFATLHELFAFNRQGELLANNLRNELLNGQLPSATTPIICFRPLFSNVQVGDAVSGWWYIKDMNYNVILPIQHLPVSDQLKSRFQVWRMRKTCNWLDKEQRDSLNREGQALEQHLLWELNVRDRSDDTVSDDSNNETPTASPPLAPSTVGNQLTRFHPSFHSAASSAESVESLPLHNMRLDPLHARILSNRKI